MFTLGRIKAPFSTRLLTPAIVLGPLNSGAVKVFFKTSVALFELFDSAFNDLKSLFKKDDKLRGLSPYGLYNSNSIARFLFFSENFSDKEIVTFPNPVILSFGVFLIISENSLKVDALFNLLVILFCSSTPTLLTSSQPRISPLFLSLIASVTFEISELLT